MSKQGKTGNGRRDFIKLAGLGAAAGSAGLVAAVAPAAAAAAEATPAGAKPGYRETDHVKKAYELARF
jgi:anaerobic selenocysteine-containing dehydrogenase